MPALSALDRLLCELIEIPSVNPSLPCDDDALKGERRVLEFLEARAAAEGLSSQRMQVLPERENLVLRIEPRGKIKARVMLTPHLDVVPANQEAFKPEIKMGRIFGRGACDTKGSVAAFFHAFLKLAKKNNRPQNTEILFVGLIDEEFAQAGSRALAAQGPKADLAIAGEPTNLKVVSAHKGSLWMKLGTEGKSAHGATPQYGINAIDRMSAVIQVLTKDYAQLLSTKEHPLLGSPSLSIGRIRGGSQPNVVPDSCEIDLDRRTLPGETQETVEREMKRLFRRKGIGVLRLSSSRSAPCPALETDSGLPLVQSFLKACKRRRTIGVPYFTDASPISMGGTPAIIYGPGNIAQAHAKTEWVSQLEVERAEQSIFRFLSCLD